MPQPRSKRPPRPPWWQCWPQVRWHFSLDTLYVLVYPEWGGVGLLTWCPLHCVDYNWRPPLPPELRECLGMKRPVTPMGGNPRRSAVHEDFYELYPLLADHLTALTYDDDPPTPRQTSTLLLFAQDGAYRACLRDRQEQRCLWVACPVWTDLLMILEGALEDPTSVWREDRLSGAETAKRIPGSKKTG